jgi:hypothetical protein
MMVGIKAAVVLSLWTIAGSSWAKDVTHPVPKLGLWHMEFLDHGQAREARVCVGPRSQPVAVESGFGEAVPNIAGVACRNTLTAQGDAMEIKTTCQGILADGAKVEIEQIARFKGDFDSKYEVSSDIAVKSGSGMLRSVSNKVQMSRLSDECSGLSDGDIDIKGFGMRNMLP